LSLGKAALSISPDFSQIPHPWRDNIPIFIVQLMVEYRLKFCEKFDPTGGKSLPVNKRYQ
jgi:hypothetical protein